METSDNIHPTIDRALVAFDHTKADRDALTEQELIRPNIELQTGIILVLGALKRLAPHRDAIAKLPESPIESFDRLEEYTLAMEHVLTLTAMPRVSADQLAEWTTSLGETRSRLLADVTALELRGFVPSGSTVNARGGKGLRNFAFDVRLFAQIILGALPAAAGKTGATVAELDAAKELATTALQAFGERELIGVAQSEIVDLRTRAFTLFIGAYDQVRRAMTYLRWAKDDVNDIVPNIYGGGHSKPAASAEAATNGEQSTGASAPGTPPVATPTPAPGAVVTSGSPAPVAATPNGAASNGASTANTAPAPGMPGASPFSHQ